MMTEDNIGYMQMPPDFKYRDVFLKGRPVHRRFDSFLIRHPPMPAARWAKIFSPFDALKGFSEAVAAKDVLYAEKEEPGDDAKRELDRKLNILRGLTRNGRMSESRRVTVRVRYFVPRTDADEEPPVFDGPGRRGRCRTVCRETVPRKPHSEEYHEAGTQGRYRTVTGTVLSVDPEAEKTVTLLCEGTRLAVSIDDIIGIENDTGIFDAAWETEAP